MWPAIANYANDELAARRELELRIDADAPLVPQPRDPNGWMARSLRGTGQRLVRIADRIDSRLQERTSS